MKRLLLTLAIATFASAMQAQLTVIESGQTQVGDVSLGQTISQDATLNIWGLRNVGAQANGGLVTFGPGIASSIYGDGGRGIISLRANNGFEFTSGTGKAVMTYSSTGNSLLFTSNLKAPSFITTSDMRLKNNIESIDGSFRGLLELTPVSYELSSSESYSIAAEENAGYESDNRTDTDDRLRFGFIAQEVLDIYPNLVVEDQEGMLGIDYTGVIPLLVDAIRNLTEQVNQQQETIAMLSGGNAPSMMPARVETQGLGQSSLMQNRPNPFNVSTLIECTLASDVRNAFICIYDLQGKQVKRIDLNERGSISCVLDASTLQPGMYIYALIADGIEIDSKRMILTD